MRETRLFREVDINELSVSYHMTSIVPKGTSTFPSGEQNRCSIIIGFIWQPFCIRHFAKSCRCVFSVIPHNSKCCCYSHLSDAETEA